MYERYNCMHYITRREQEEGHKLSQWHFGKSSRSAEIWTQDLLITTQMLLSLSHLNWIVSRCSLHMLLSAFHFHWLLLHLNDLCNVMRTHFSTKVRKYTQLPLLLNALFLGTLTIYQEVWRADKCNQMWEEVFCILLVLSVYQYPNKATLSHLYVK